MKFRCKHKAAWEKTINVRLLDKTWEMMERRRTNEQTQSPQPLDQGLLNRGDSFVHRLEELRIQDEKYQIKHTDDLDCMYRKMSELVAKVTQDHFPPAEKPAKKPWLSDSTKQLIDLKRTVWLSLRLLLES